MSDTNAPAGSPFDMPLEGSWEERGGWVVRALARDLNWPLHVAAGFVGNLGYESIGFTTLQEIKPLVSGSKGGTGFAQWTGMSGPYPRRLNFETWCAQHNLSPTSDEGNYGFVLYELLDGGMKGSDFVAFANRMRSFDTIEAACHYTHEWYERPQEVLDGLFTSGPKRLAYAKRALAGAHASAPPTDIYTGEPSPGMVVDHAKDLLAILDGEIKDAVKLLQTLLQKRGLYPGKPGWIDGDPGPATEKALREWRALR